MNIRTCAALLLAVGLPTAVFAVDYPEIEPNETKAQALTNGAFTLSSGDSVSGVTTGTSTTASTTTATADTFLVKTAAASLGIYRHRMTITTTGTAGHTGTLRGLASTSTGVTAGGDAAFQTSGSAAVGTTAARTNQWYGFGKQEQVYYRVTGGTSTTGTYTSTLATDVITPTAFATNPESGAITINHNAATDTAYDKDMFLFDSNLNPIVGMDDADTTAMSVNLAAGTYYIGYGRWNSAAGTLAGAVTAPAIGGIQGTGQTYNVFDFADVVGSSSTANGTVAVTMNITAPNGAHSAVGATLGGAYEMAWFTFTVNPAVTPTNPTGTGSAAPAYVVNDGTGVATLKVTVTNGTNPASTFLTTGSVTVDGSSVGAGTVTLLDNGVAPDAVAGDNIFSGNATVANGTATGTATLPFTITDDQARVGSGNINFAVTPPHVPCASGLSSLTFGMVSSDGAIGDVNNSVVTGDFGLAGSINTLRLTGRLFSVTATPYNLEARIRATSPDGSFYDIQPFTTTPSVSPRDLTSFDFTLPALEDGTGTWTFQFWESYDDSTTPDNTWQQICITADAVSTPIAATDTATPATVVRDGVATATLAVTVIPGQYPTSSGVSVVVDASSVGGSGSLALADDGVAPDAAAGDNIFSGTTTVAYTTALGTATLPYTVTDAESRSFAGSLNFTVGEASGACCTGSGCVVTTIGDCLDVQGGTFAGTGTACTAPTALSTDGAGAFEDISASGTVLAALTGQDDFGASVALPFNFTYFGNTYSSIRVVTNGFAQFTGTSTEYLNAPVPSAGIPNDGLYVLWDDHDFDLTGDVYTEMLGTIGTDARFIIQWNNVGQYNSGAAPTDSNTFQIALFEDGSFEYRYLALGGEAAGSSGAGDTTTIGFENSTGTIGSQSAETRASLIPQLPISFRANSTMNDTGVCGPTCPPCAADYDNNGGVDGGDLAAFFADFEAGETCADVDQNGGVDGGDLAFFFTVFEAGGC